METKGVEKLGMWVVVSQHDESSARTVTIVTRVFCCLFCFEDVSVYLLRLTSWCPHWHSLLGLALPSSSLFNMLLPQEELVPIHQPPPLL